MSGKRSAISIQHLAHEAFFKLMNVPLLI